ncbi:ABC transporter substrate-binding protein [Halovivax sp.]|uniref:ABC transporter substrate-binding protein n=1 Tax=Halovivax sp. TaxID=1935978 RepID=UPI0025C0A8CF|nr:ABC transporter substrate-binding protein [Halovivax sp.]
MDRRTALAALGGLAGATLAGCLEREAEDEPPEEEEENDDEGVLRVVAPEPFVRPEDGPGRWLAERFPEGREDAEITWISPETGLDYFLERARRDVPFGADVYLGLAASDVARAGQATSAVFRPLDRGSLTNDHRPRPRFSLADPHDRALAVLADYTCLLHDADANPPTSFGDLVESTYAETLVVPDARASAVGRSFLHWTVAEFGEDEAFTRWRELRDGGVRVEPTWSDAHDAYLADPDALLAGRASRRVTAGRAGEDPDRHRVAYPDDRGYARPTYVAIFDGTPRRELAHEFVDALLSNEVQAELVERTDRFPSVDPDELDLSDDVTAFADEPIESISLDYGDLVEAQEEWLEAWADAVGVGD